MGGRNLIVFSCLLVLVSCATTPPTPTTSAIAAETVAQADSAAPAVASIAFRGSPASGDTFGLGETLEVNVRFDTTVTATGSPQVALTIGTQTRHATLSSWSRQSLYFSYTVQEEDRDEDGVSIPANALLLNGGTITAADGTTDADLRHRAVGTERGSKVNGSLITPPGVRDIAFICSPARCDTYELGESVEVVVEFDRAVMVTGSPQVALTIGTQTRQAAYSKLWRDARYAHFSYAVQEGDLDEDGIGIAANALALNGGTIKHAADRTTDADITHYAVAADPARRVNGSLVTRPAGECHLLRQPRPASDRRHLRSR